MNEDTAANARRQMVREQIEARGISDARVLEALRAVPRHVFAPGLADPYADAAQAIGAGQTISQPYIVALMTESLGLTGTEKVLEVGAGSGYQTAVLARLCREVVAVERHESLAVCAQRALSALGVANVRLHVGDGSRGWAFDAPFDAILVAANAPAVPPALLDQLAPGGRLVLPVGPEEGPQRLLLLTTSAGGAATITTRHLCEVGFVPLVGAHGWGLPGDLGEMDV